MNLSKITLPSTTILALNFLKAGSSQCLMSSNIVAFTSYASSGMESSSTISSMTRSRRPYSVLIAARASSLLISSIGSRCFITEAA